MKRIFKSGVSIFLAITIVFSSALVGLDEVDFSDVFVVGAGAASSGVVNTDISWELSDDGVLTISGTGDMPDDSPFYSSSEIKEVVINEGITSIGTGTFSFCYNIISILIPDSVKSIGDRAFYCCDSLETISIPDSVISIGGDAFRLCDSLVAINVGENNSEYSSVDGVLFNKNKTTLLKYPSGKSDTSYMIPESVTCIEKFAFNDCINLESITIPEGVTSIGESAFSGCANIKSIKIPDAVTCINSETFGDCNSLTSITIPNNVTSIGKFAFVRCISLESVTINGGIKIDTGAFSNCTNLKLITLGKGVTNIDGNDLSSCTNLMAIKVDEKNTKYSSVDGVLFNKDKTKLLKYPSGKTNTTYTIPNSVTSIGSYAFKNCTNLESITMPGKVTSIGDSAFSGCISIASIKLPNSVKTIGGCAFMDCESLTAIAIPDSVTNLGYCAFYGCSNLVSATVGNGVKRISASAFSGCESLVSVTIGNSVSSIDGSSFIDCSSLEKINVNINNSFYSSVDGVLFNKNKTELLKYPSGITNTAYVISDSVTNISYGAFSGCTSLDAVTLGKGLTSVDNLLDCKNLKAINVTDGNPVYSSVDGVLFNKDKTELLKYPEGKTGTSYIIPDSVTSIQEGAFRYCTNLISITIPDSVTSIREGAFRYCTNLISITIPDSVVNIGEYAFYNCTSLASITIPDSIKNISYYTFNDCTNLKSIIIPDSVTDIEIYAFYNTGYYNDESNWENDLLYINNHLIKAKDTVSGDCVIKAGTKTVADYTFDGCTSVTSVSVPDSVTSIDGTAFSNCISLKEIKVDINNSEYSSVDGVLFNKNKTELLKYPAGKTDTAYIIPDGLKTISESAFRSCTNLVSVVIPDSVTDICRYAFSYCRGLSSITIPRNVTSIDERVFFDCISMASIVLPDSITSIGNEAFGCCESLVSIVIPDSVTSIGEGAFSGCAGLTSITIPGGITEIKRYTFQACTGLTSVTIPDSVTSIGESAFSGCAGLTSITIPYGVKSIGFDAFYDCENLTSVELPDSLISVDPQAFAYCTSLKEITIPDSVKSIGGYAFGYLYDEKVPGFIIYGTKDSAAEIYAKEYGLKFIFDCDHTAVKWVTIKDSTCIATGTKQKMCSDCGEVFEIVTISKKAHIASGWKTDKKATVNAAGLKHKECTKCKKVLETAKITQLKCSTPKLIKIENTASGVKITWGKVSGADKFKVYRKTKGKSWKYLGSATSAYYTDKKAKSGNKYYYAIKATNEAGDSSFSNSLSKYYLSDPTLKTPKSTNSGVTLTWTKVSSADGYVVYRKTGSGSYKKLKTIKGYKKVKYTDKSAKKGKTYTYKVKAYKSKTYSAYSNAKKIKDKY